MADIIDFNQQANAIAEQAEIKTKESLIDSDKQLIPAAEDDPEKKKEVAKAVFQYLENVVNAKIDLGLHERWQRNYEMLRGKHWRSNAERKIPFVTANLCFLHHQRTVNTLTDNNPTFNVVHVDKEALTEDPENNVYSDLQKTATHWWVDQEQQEVLERSVSNGETYGVSIEKVIFNPDLEMGIGEVETICVDPYHFGFYPFDNINDPRDIQKSQIVFHFYPIPLSEARRLYPDADIQADSDLLKDLQDERKEINSPTASTKGRNIFVSVASTVRQIFGYKTGESTDSDEVLMVECWVKDYTKVKVKTTVSLNGITETSESESPKYPGDIRYILCCNGEKVLEDRGNPNVNPNLPVEQASKTYLYDKFPFSMVNSVKDSVSPWGYSDIEQLEWLNMEMDKALSQMVLEKDRAARRKIINPKDSGIPNSDFTNFSSILNPANSEKSKAVRYLDYPKIEQDIMQSITLFKDLFLQIAGTFEVDQAQMRGNDAIAYKAIAALMERAATMQRGKIRAYGRLIRERGRMFLSHVMNFYNEDRWISYDDKDGVPKTKKINGAELIVPAKLTVVTGSTLPISRVQVREEALSLYKERAIDREALLEALEWSGRGEVIERMNAGPVGQVMSALKTVGVPDQFLQYFQKIATLNPQKLEGMMQSQQIPPFNQVLDPYIQQTVQQMGVEMPEQQPDPETRSKITVNEAEAQRKIAEAGKFAAQQALAVEQINTEKVKQAVASMGIEFDSQKLDIEKARTVADIRKNVRDTVKEVKQMNEPAISSTPAPSQPSPTNPVTPSATDYPAGYNERGMKSNNQL